MERERERERMSQSTINPSLNSFLLSLYFEMNIFFCSLHVKKLLCHHHHPAHMSLEVDTGSTLIEVANY